MNKNGRTDIEEAAANKTGGKLNQIKGNVKEVIGTVLGDEESRREGRRDHLQGRLQEEYGNLKEKEAKIEDALRDVELDGRV